MRLEGEILETRRKTLRKRKRFSQILAQDWLAWNVPDDEDEENLEPESQEQLLQQSQESQEPLEYQEISQEDWEENYIEIPVSQGFELPLPSEETQDDEKENLSQQSLKVEPQVEVKMDVKLDEYLNQLPKLAPSNDAVADREFKKHFII